MPKIVIAAASVEQDCSFWRMTLPLSLIASYSLLLLVIQLLLFPEAELKETVF